MRVASISIALSVAPALVAQLCAAQVRDMGGATPLHVRVHVVSLTTSGDTSRVTYVAENLAPPASGEDMWQLLVDAPSPPIRVDAPTGGQWETQKSHRDIPTALWVNFGDSLVTPGHSSPSLVYSALGLPDLIKYWAVPDLVTHSPVDDDSNANIEPLKPFADSGMTVGIVPTPRTMPTSDLLLRLRGLLDYSCGAPQWISDATVCDGLRSKLDNASTALGTGDTVTAKGALSALVQQLDAQHGNGPGKHVSDEAYALLRPNAVYLRDRIGS